ncbi:MAG: LytR C-terminal domain-containing protein [Candidatus Shapirobacteria bacterium]|jgi:hypothetical protein
MSFFSKPKVVIWPKNKSLEIYIDRKENNFFSLDINIWEEKSDKDLESLVFCIHQNKISSCSILIPDDIVITKSFVYDTKITDIDKKEVIGLANSLVPFDIDPDFIEYNLLQENDKTVINSIIFDKSKIDCLKNNLNKINLQIDSLKPVSSAISQIISTIYLSEFFLIYPLNDYEYTLLLSKNNQIYLTTNFKGPSLDIQKTINYAQLYFSNPVKKLYYPEGKEIEIITSTEMEKTTYNENQIAQNFNKPNNLPLPIIGEISAIINTPKNISSSKVKKMNNKKNILPIIAVLIFSAAIVSFIVYFVFNKNKDETMNEDILNEESINPTVTENIITSTPTPTITEISKTIKLQVLNATEINGQAATLKATLVALGFTNVTVGNATVTATENTVSVKTASTSAYFNSKLVTDFPATYTTDLKTTSPYDAVFTIGTDLSTGTNTTKTATTTPTLKVTTTPTDVE